MLRFSKTKLPILVLPSGFNIFVPFVIESILVEFFSSLVESFSLLAEFLSVFFDSSSSSSFLFLLLKKNPGKILKTVKTIKTQVQQGS